VHTLVKNILSLEEVEIKGGIGNWDENINSNVKTSKSLIMVVLDTASEELLVSNIQYLELSSPSQI